MFTIDWLSKNAFILFIITCQSTSKVNYRNGEQNTIFTNVSMFNLLIKSTCYGMFDTNCTASGCTSLNN